MLSVCREIVQMMFPKRYTLEAISDRQIKALRNQGAKIGNNVTIINTKIDGLLPPFLNIGDNVTLTNCRILIHDASMKKFTGYSKFGRVTIGDNVYVGADAIILCNTKIGNNVIVGAGCVVSKNIEDNSVVIGNPCRRICSFDDWLQKQKLRIEQHGVYNDYPWELNNDELLNLVNVSECKFFK